MRATSAFVLLTLLGVGCGSDGNGPPPEDAAADTAEPDLEGFVKDLPTSCAFDCKKGCPDEKAQGPFVCPAMVDWSAMPHAAACGGPPSPPAAISGRCVAAAPTGEALRPAGAVDATTFVLPDGHRITPAGAEVELVDDAHLGGFPVRVARVPGTRFALVVEAGFGDHLVRSIDTDALAAGAGKKAIVSTVVVPRANWGIAVAADGSGKHRAYVSGGALGKVHVVGVDDATGVLAVDAKATIDLGTVATADGAVPFFATSLAVTPDGARLVVGAVKGSEARIVSLAAADYGTRLASAALGGNEHFGVAIDPKDVAGEVAWAPLWGDAKIVAFDTRTGAIKQTVPTGKNPEGFAFLDGRWMAVAAADGDVLTIVDRVAGAVAATVPIGAAGAHGFSPTAMTWDPVAHRLYVAETILDAIEVFDVALDATKAPVLTSLGRIPTAWWPTDVVFDGGKLLVVEGRGYGAGKGRTGKAFGPGVGEIAESMKGTFHLVDLAALDLGAATKKVAANAALADVGGYPTVTCPDGAPYDFPVPRTNTEGASKLITHVVWIVRENKNFDSLLGDLPGVSGDASLVMAPGKMDDYWRNLRRIARTWTVADNYYTDAEYSNQGHVWLTYGRTTDYTERTWVVAAAGKGRESLGGVLDVGRAQEGSVFEWLLGHDQEFDILGEGTGLPKVPAGRRNPVDSRYPGIVQNVGLEDVTKSCYFAARARALCDLHSFVYMTLPNDHTFGGGGSRPSPGTMIAVNDEATGVVLDALGRSPFWASTLVVITEDDPQDGGDHVDLHRTPLVFAGPWIKKGYVAKAHYDVASLVKLLAHLRGLPYPNEVVARAPLPLEMFTSTPDFATYQVAPRAVPLACNGEGTPFSLEAKHWDFDDLDEQPGLGAQLRRMFAQGAAF